jgi:hypothetical protein
VLSKNESNAVTPGKTLIRKEIWCHGVFIVTANAVTTSKCTVSATSPDSVDHVDGMDLVDENRIPECYSV